MIWLDPINDQQFYLLAGTLVLFIRVNLVTDALEIF
jgi:hypothetical protein